MEITLKKSKIIISKTAWWTFKLRGEEVIA